MKLILKVGGFIALMVFGVMQALEMGSARTWPSVTGTITRSHIDSATMTRHNTTRTEYTVRVAYNYQVAGAHFTGNRTDIRPISSSRQSAERELANYPVGKTVTVYYDPEKPERSVLKR